MSARQTYSLEQIKDMLTDRVDQVAHHYAPPCSGSWTDRGRYYTLNPGRPDTRPGSFMINLAGRNRGRWVDFASHPLGGDLIDLIALALGCNLSDAVREARAFLGLEVDTPEVRMARAKAAERAKAQRAAAERDERAEAERACKAAAGLYLSAEVKLTGTPVDLYLRGRGIDLAALPHPPGALRYHAALTYHHETMDPETGEVTEQRLKFPAMLAAMVDGRGRITACHRTYLHWGQQGRIEKAPVPAQKKVLGRVKGSSIRLSSGIGPKGGKGAPLAQCPPGSRVYIAEGIETALSCCLLKPEARVLACYSLSNMGAVELPANVAEVVLLCDGDSDPQAVAAFEAAVKAHAAKGRLVRVWQSDVPGEDLNDALQRALSEQQGAA